MALLTRVIEPPKRQVRQEIFDEIPGTPCDCGKPPVLFAK